MGVKTFTKQLTSAKSVVDPPENALKQLAIATKNFIQFQDVMSTLWKRLDSTGKDYVHVQKSLYCLKYLLLHGSDQVLTEARVHKIQISTLTDFSHPLAQPNGGSIIRERAHEVMALLNDEENLAAERAALAK